MSAKTIMQLAVRIVKGKRVTIPALRGREFKRLFDMIRSLKKRKTQKQSGKGERI